ncbi:DUF2064 domain-containing protein [soil metagenome]
MQIVVIAKAPVPGSVKTRLSPPCTPDQAAAIAAAALADTLATVRSVPVHRRVVTFDGDPAHPDVDLAGFDVLAQHGTGLGARLSAAFADAAAGPGAGLGTLLIGMDTPQLDAALLDAALAPMRRGEAVFGHAADGGWWALGLPDPAYADVLADVPMSLPDTGRRTERALRARGLALTPLPVLRDVDTIADAAEVAALAPGSGFARAFAEIMAGAP